MLKKHLVIILFMACLKSYGLVHPLNVLNDEKAIQGSINQKLKNAVDKHASKALNNDLINALSIGVYVNGTPYSFHYGELTKNKGDKPTDKTIYEIASVTKTFTGTLAAKAVLEGRLNLEDDVREYLPAPYANLEYEGEPIKIKHLLTHTGGLPGGLLGFTETRSELNEIEFSHEFLGFENNQTKEQFFKELGKLRITSRPGSEFIYSNPSSNLMGFILERVYACSFQELILKEVVAKANMEDTHFQTPESKKDRLANGYLLDSIAPATNLATRLWGAEGALKSTMSDLLRYIRYQIENNAIVNESHRKLYEIDKEYWIGYYWWVISNQNHDLHFRHDGGITKAKNILVIYPEKEIGISVVTNQSSLRVNEDLNELIYSIYREVAAL